MFNINWEIIKVLVLDVDGTLYNQSRLRKKMIFELLKYYIFRPWKYKEMIVLSSFRSEREKMAGSEILDLEEEQYKITARKLNITVNEVKEVVDKWIFDFPNQFLMRYSYKGVQEFIHLMNQNDIQTVVYSDYISGEKLQHLKLSVNMNIASTDRNISSLKPNPKALQYILNQMHVDAKSCLYIGDRDELDGLCAAAVGMPYLNIRKCQPDTFYCKLIEHFESYNKTTNGK